MGDRNRVNVIENFSAFCSPPLPSFAPSFFLRAIPPFPRLEEKPKNYRGLTANFILAFFSFLRYFIQSIELFSIEKKNNGDNLLHRMGIDSQRGERERKKERNNTTELDISVKRGVIE